MEDQRLKDFNWGAFLLSWIWGVGNKSYITLISLPIGLICGFIPIIGPAIILGLCIWFGIMGNRWAYANKEWENIDSFIAIQKKWAIAGLIAFVLCFIIGIILGIIAVLLFASNGGIK